MRQLSARSQRAAAPSEAVVAIGCHVKRCIIIVRVAMEFGFKYSLSHDRNGERGEQKWYNSKRGKLTQNPITP